MYCIIQRIDRKKCSSYGSYKKIETYTNEWTIYDKRYKKYYYRYTGERFKRNIKTAYKITIHQSYREKGKVRKKQWNVCTLGYYDLIEFCLYDCANMKISAISEDIGVDIEKIYNLIEYKLNPIIEKIMEEFHQTEEYRVHEEHKVIINTYLKNKKEFELKYGDDTYDFYYDVFGVLREEEKLNKLKKDYEKQQGYEESYYKNYNSSRYHISNNRSYSDKEKKYLKIIYKAAAFKLHPDTKNDNGEGMKFLNSLKEEWGI